MIERMVVSFTLDALVQKVALHLADGVYGKKRSLEWMENAIKKAIREESQQEGGA
jgi:hypothetical protein